MSAEADPVATRQRRISRAVYGTFGLLVTAFIVYSTVQVVRVLFFGAPDSGRPLPAACAEDLRRMLGALDRAAIAADAAPDERTAREAFRAAIAPEWTDLGPVRAACDDPDAEEALAAAERLERAHEAHAGDRAARTSGLRRDLERRIGGPTHADSR